LASSSGLSLFYSAGRALLLLFAWMAKIYLILLPILNILFPLATFTGQKINYVAHSQGSTMMFAALSEQNPVVKQHLNKFIAVGPVAYIGNCKSRLLTFLADENVGGIVKMLRVYEFLPRSWFLRSSEVLICKYFNFICGDVLSLIADHNTELDNMERMDVLIGKIFFLIFTFIYPGIWGQNLINPEVWV
jgi:hypothetical protein